MIYDGITDWTAYEYMMAVRAFITRYFRSKEINGWEGNGGINS